MAHKKWRHTIQVQLDQRMPRKKLDQPLQTPIHRGIRWIQQQSPLWQTKPTNFQQKQNNF